MEKYDIIIAGAGPAGLSVASELSKDFDILVLDKNPIPLTFCSWYSYQDRVRKYKLEDAVLNRCSSLLFKAGDKSHVMKDKCVILEEKKVLNIFMEKTLSNGATIGRNNLVDYRNEGKELIVKTQKGNLKARLMIDCMGINSPILKRNKLIKYFYAWTCFGSKINNIKVNDTDQIRFMPVGDKHNSYITFYPINKRRASFYIFRDIKQKVSDPLSFRNTYNSVLKKHFPKANKLSMIKGNIISGELKKYALNNIVFFGESGMLTPPACGMGFNEILMKHKDFSKGIKSAFDDNKLKEKDLSNVSLKLRNNDTINFQRIIANFSYYFINSPDKWEGGVQWLNALGNMSRYWMRNEISLEWIEKAALKLYKTIPLKESVKYMPKEDFLFISTQFARFMEKSIITESENLLRNYHPRIPHLHLFSKKKIR